MVVKSRWWQRIRYR